MKKELIKSVLGTLIVILFVVTAVWYVIANYDDFAKLTITEPWYILPAILAIVLNIYASGVVIDLAIEPHGVKLTRKEAFGLASITRFSNQFSPSYVGATIRAAYMKRVYGVSYAKFSSSFIISNLLQFMISGLFTIATFIALDPSSKNDKLLYFVIGAVVLFVAILYAPLKSLTRFTEKRSSKDNKKGKFFERLHTIIEGYSTVRSHPKLLPRTIFWMIIITISFSMSYYLLYAALGFHISIVSAFFIAALSGWSILIAITPGNLGIREGLMVIAAQVAGVPISVTLLVAILVRVLMFVTSGALSAYYSPRLLHTSIFRLGSQNK